MSPIHVVLSIVGSQTDAEGEQTRVELFTEGELIALGPDAWRLQYDETELSGMAGSTTSLTLKSGHIQLERSGTHSAMMMFEQGKHNTLLYMTPAGVLEMGICPTFVHYQVDGHQGSLRLEYALDIQGQRAGSNEMTVHFRPRQDHERTA